MPRPTRSRRKPDFDDYEDDDFEDDIARQAGAEKTKQLVLDLLGRWHWITLGLILGVLAGVFYLSKAPKVYEAKSTILVKQQTSSVMSSRENPDEMDLKTAEAINTVAQRITRPELLLKVATLPEIQSLPGLIPQPVVWLPDWMVAWIGDSKTQVAKVEAKTPEQLAGAIQDWTQVAIRRNTRLLDVSVSHPDPLVAKTLADTIATTYQADLTGTRSDDRNNSLQILVAESEAARTRLQKAQNALANYQRAIETLKELELKETAVRDLERRYLPKHPKMIAANGELSTFRTRFLAEFDAARNSAADRDYWDGVAAELQQAGDDPAEKAAVARRLLLARGNVLESEIASQTSVFNSILTRIQEADINQQAVESEMEISSLAKLPEHPVSPKKPMVLAAAGIGGLGFGLVLALLFTRLDNKIHTVSQVERETGLPALAAISNIELNKLDKPSGGKESKDDSPAQVKARKLWTPLLLFREGISTSTYAEMFRVLRASVSLLGDERKRKITLFTSALPGEGKTMVSSNFALAAAQQGKRTILIDLDLRKPAVHKIFGLKRDSHSGGVTDVLSGQKEFADAVLKETGAKNLDLMLAGKQAPNPGELLNASTLEEFLEKALAEYEVVVLDSAPLLAVPDTRIIAPLADNFCLVVRADQTPKGAVRRVLEVIAQDKKQFSGLVFNGFTEKRRLIGQNYTYGNYRDGKGYRYSYGAYGNSED